MNLSFLKSGVTMDIFVRLAESLLHFVWQGAVLAAIVLVVDRFLRGWPAQVRYSLHVTTLLLMLTCVPVTYAVLARQQKGEAVAAASTVDKEVAASPTAVIRNSESIAEHVPFAADKHPNVADARPLQSTSLEQTWDRLRTIAHLAAPYAACAYLLGVALMFGRLALALMGGHRLCSEARQVTEPNLLSMVARQTRKIGLRAAPVVAWCGRTSVPLVAGLVKPMILLPVALTSSLTPDQLEAILAHELAHLRRFDLFVNLLQRVTEALLFFHPAVWYVSRRISTERENCCDDSVLLAGWGRVQYADALVRMAEICAPSRGISGLNAATILAASGSNPSQFKQRIMRLLGEQESLRLGVSRGAAIAMLAGVLAVLLAIPALFSAPSLVAQNEKSSPPSDTLAKNDREPETIPGHYRVSFRETPWKDVLAWYQRVMGDSIETKTLPVGNFNYESSRPLDHREISLLINSELLRRGLCLAQEGKGFSVQPAEVIARQYAEQLRKDFMHGHELRKGKDRFETYFEIVECRIAGQTKPPAPSGPAIAYVLKASRDFSAQEATTFFSACFADVSTPSLQTGQLILADGFAVLHGGKWLGAKAPTLQKGEQIEVWQNYAQEWNSRPPKDYHLVVRGLIVGPDGKPVAAARVQQLLLEGAPDGPEGEKLRAFLNWAYGGEPIVDKDGKFLVSLNQYSQFVRNAYFHISAPGFAPQRVGPITIDSAKPPVELKIELRPGFSGRLRLGLPDGKPLDKGELEITVQDDLWAWGQSMTKLPVGGEPITVPNCPTGPLLLKVRMPGFAEQEIRDVQLVADKVLEVKVAPMPPPNPQNPKPRDGIHRVFDRSGKFLLREQNYKDGKLHGPSLHFESNGAVRGRENYKEGKLDGFRRTYDGEKVIAETFYQDGKAEGKTFYRYGDYQKTGQYLMGKPEGTWTAERTGEWKLVKNYKDGLLDGLWERKTADGKRDLRLTFEKGMLADKDDAVPKVPFLLKVSALAKTGDAHAKRMLDALHVDMDLEYPQTPAGEVIMDLHLRLNMPLYLDNLTSDAPGLAKRPIIINEKGIPVFLGLHEIGAKHELVFDYRFHALWLTTPKAAAAWKDFTGVSDLKPADGSPLAKALPEPPKFDLLATPISKLAEPLQREYGLALDASRVTDAKWTGWQRSLSFRDSLSILLYQNNCRCREEGDKLIIEPVGVPPTEKAEPAKEKGAGLRINVPALGPTPLALDFAFPVNSKGTDPKQCFSFFFGVLR